jgi:hypothetical protein
MDNKQNDTSTASMGLNMEAWAFAPPMAGGNLRLPEFWPENPRRWFAMAEAQFMLRRVSSGVDRYCHVLTTLPRSSYRLILHLVEDVPSEESYILLKEALMQAHQHLYYQRVELLSKVELLGNRKPSDLLAAMIELCPCQHIDSPFFLYFFLHRLPREIRVLLAEEDPKDMMQIAEMADRSIMTASPLYCSRPTKMQTWPLLSCFASIRAASSAAKAGKAARLRTRMPAPPSAGTTPPSARRPNHAPLPAAGRKTRCPGGRSFSHASWDFILHN